MTHANGELVTEVRQAIQTALCAGRPAPGRPTLVRLTGATDHAIRKALAQLAAENAGGSPTAPAARRIRSPGHRQCGRCW